MFYLFSPYLSPDLSIHEILSAFPLFFFRKGLSHVPIACSIMTFTIMMDRIISKEECSLDVINPVENHVFNPLLRLCAFCLRYGIEFF